MRRAAARGSTANGLSQRRWCSLRALRLKVHRFRIRSRKIERTTCHHMAVSRVLPEAEPVTLGEGFTPMLRSREFDHVFIKDEGRQSDRLFKARGLACASRWRRHSARPTLALPIGGQRRQRARGLRCGGRAQSHVFMPKDVPRANRIESPGLRRQRRRSSTA